jgi:regulator of protease activity HflC (stomatin/prohibitin superfamily)
MDTTLITIAVALVAVALVTLMLSVRIVQQYERGVVFRLGRVGRRDSRSSHRSWTGSVR